MIWGFVLLTVVGAEVAGYLYYWRLHNFVKKKRYYKTEVDNIWMENYLIKDLDPSELKNLIQNSISYNVSKIDGYYTVVPFEKLPRKKMLKWTSYYLFYKSLWQLEEDQLKFAEGVLDKIEDKLNIKFVDIIDDDGEDGGKGTKEEEEGNKEEKDMDESDIYFLKFGSNKIYTSYRPLIVYTGLNIMKNICYFRMYRNGFEKHITKNSKITYFYYGDKNNNKTSIFIHGLGFGILPYLSYIFELKKSTNLIVPILPNISNMEFTSYFTTLSDNKLFPTYENWRKDFREVLQKHSVESFDIIGHSFGTIIIGILLKDKWIYKRLNKRILIDPVCFIDKSYKIYRYINEPYIGDTNPIVNKLFNMVVYNDVHLRYVIQRYLYGPEFWIMNYNNMNVNNSLIVLSKNDQLVPSDNIYNRLKKHNIPCIMAEEASHSQIFLYDKFKSVLSTIKYYLLF